MIAALYVETDGTYFGLPNVEPWDAKRDARTYAGPHAVIAHPPCERWGRYWHGGPSSKVRKKRGDDGGCFEAALASVRRWGGVLEHPAHTSAWKAFGLVPPPLWGRWGPVDLQGGFGCSLEQGRYGHQARKCTWLYMARCQAIDLDWGPMPPRQRLDEGFHTAEERKAARAAGRTPRPRTSTAQNLATPVAFRDVLIRIAESANR